MKRFLILSMVLGLMAGSVATAEAAKKRKKPTRIERTVKGAYGPYPAPVTGCNEPLGSWACLIVPTRATETFFTAKVTDAHGQPVFVEVTGGARATFCGETVEPIEIHPGSSLEFHLALENWPGDVGLNCPAHRIKTTGTISVTLSSVERRSVDLVLSRHLRGVGSVVATDASCRSYVPVVIQRKTSDAWVDIASTSTDAEGAFALRLKDRPGRYRAVASEIGTPESTCLVTRSATVRHHHQRRRR